MGKEKTYFNEIKKKIEPLKEVVYYEPISENEILELEKEWKISFKPIIREFLINFGFTQDIFKKLKMDKDDIKDNLDWLREHKLENYIPIKTKLTAKGDLIIGLKNDDFEDDHLYEINLEEKDISKKIKKRKKTFTEIIDKSINKINVKKRCKNNNKIRLTEFTIKSSNLEDLLSAMEEAKIKQLTNWQDKYFPQNPFGTKLAKFELYEKVRLLVEKDESETQFRFELEEPILLNKNESLILKTEELLKKSKLEFDEIKIDIIEKE